MQLLFCAAHGRLDSLVLRAAFGGHSFFRPFQTPRQRSGFFCSVLPRLSKPVPTHPNSPDFSSYILPPCRGGCVPRIPAPFRYDAVMNPVVVLFSLLGLYVARGVRPSALTSGHFRGHATPPFHGRRLLNSLSYLRSHPPTFLFSFLVP